MCILTLPQSMCTLKDLSYSFYNNFVLTPTISQQADALEKLQQKILIYLKDSKITTKNSKKRLREILKSRKRKRSNNKRSRINNKKLKCKY